MYLAKSRGLTYLIVEEFSKTIEIINSRALSVYCPRTRAKYIDNALEFIISIVFLGFMGDKSL